MDLHSFSKLSTPCNIFDKCSNSPQALKHNGSLYAHVFFARSGYPPDPKDPEYQPLAAFGRTHRMLVITLSFFSSNSFTEISSSSVFCVLAAAVVAYFPKSKADKRRHLLGTSEGLGSGEAEKVSEVRSLVFFCNSVSWSL